ncbi:MAG: hypothetical protein FWC28_03000 [Proteobacteria bacterium]|nr:hypothetical protein [Cystobacterineae bacterium]MCL2259340.1 hypothetical protein [Cystobacterineae bacterium]MCL2314206.1 hypothetical protein [Pseudomonadota bacterium]
MAGKTDSTRRLKRGTAGGRKWQLCFLGRERKSSCIIEEPRMEADIVTSRDVFYFKQEGLKPKVEGCRAALGFVFGFHEKLPWCGIPIHMGIFREE